VQARVAKVKVGKFSFRPVRGFQGQGVHAKSESKRDAPKVYKPRARSLLDDGLFRPTVAEARLVYKTMR
ncbi:hypothetical protein, partial [Burkholderia ubonensis]|uniref:hypothetical protein n=1 Tax=Burkholderia ubonensis TaxID=101571 RepID=UPI000AB3AEE2